VTDHPTVFTTLTISGQSKRVRDYAGAAPPWLQTLDQEIDRLADTHRWRHGDPKAELFGGARLNEDTYMPKPGVTPLMKAVVQQTPEEIAALLKAGADINAEDASGWTPLMYAAQAGKLENLKLVVASGGKAGHRSAAGETALFAAVSSWDDPTARVKLLKAAGTDINAKDKHGTSALMIAAQHFWIPDLIATMIELGADKTQRDVSGRTAADLLEVQRQQTPDPDHYGAARALLALR
jgi:ankyrin repeat protein